MLIKNHVLSRIKEGKVTQAFWRWEKPTVVPGTVLHTPVGLFVIDSIKSADEDGLTAADAVSAGYADLPQLLKDVRRRPGQLYRMGIRFKGTDPRVDLRENKVITPEELAIIKKKLAKLDTSSRTGPWTHKMLLMIAAHPNVKSAELAQIVGMQKERLKTETRKLINLGFVISCKPGYEIAPRGVAFLQLVNRPQRR